MSYLHVKKFLVGDPLMKEKQQHWESWGRVCTWEKGLMEASLNGDGEEWSVSLDVSGKSGHSPGQADPAWGWVGHGDLQTPLPASTILWFCEPSDELCFVQFMQFLTAFVSHGCSLHFLHLATHFMYYKNENTSLPHTCLLLRLAPNSSYLDTPVNLMALSIWLTSLACGELRDRGWNIFSILLPGVEYIAFSWFRLAVFPLTPWVVTWPHWIQTLPWAHWRQNFSQSLLSHSPRSALTFRTSENDTKDPWSSSSHQKNWFRKVWSLTPGKLLSVFRGMHILTTEGFVRWSDLLYDSPSVI